METFCSLVGNSSKLELWEGKSWALFRGGVDACLLNAEFASCPLISFQEWSRIQAPLRQAIEEVLRYLEISFLTKTFLNLSRNFPRVFFVEDVQVVLLMSSTS